MLKASLRPSHILAAILLLAHGAAITVVALVDMPPWLQLIVIAVLLANLAYVVTRAALLRTSGSVVALEVTSDNAVNILTREGEWIECEVQGTTYVASFLTVLNLRESEKGDSKAHHDIARQHGRRRLPATARLAALETRHTAGLTHT